MVNNMISVWGKKIAPPIVGLSLLAPVLYLVFAGEELSGHQFFFLKLVAALAAAGIASIIPGYLHLNMPVRDILIRSGGAVAIFVIVWFTASPPPVCDCELGDGVFEMQTEGFLGDFKDFIDSEELTSTFRLEFADNDEAKLNDFFINQRVVGNSYGELIMKICKKSPCLICEPLPTAETKKVTVSLRSGNLETTQDSEHLTRKRLICPAVQN